VPKPNEIFFVSRIFLRLGLRIFCRLLFIYFDAYNSRPIKRYPNMRSLLLLSVLLFPICAKSQPSVLLHGTWNTHNSSQSAVITSDLVKARVFAITSTSMTACPGPGACTSVGNIAFEIYVDGNALVKHTLMEGSTAFIEAKRIVIKQVIPDTGDPTMFPQGTWKAVQEPEIATVSYSFGELPPSRKHLLANFATAQDFIVDFGPYNTSTQPCTSGFMMVYVEDRAVANPLTNTPAEFPLGSSFHGYGKNVAVSFTGTCPAKRGFTGNMRFLKDKPVGPAIDAQ
jgi:hypothetical protein